MKRKKSFVKKGIGFLLSLLVIINFGISASAGVNGAEALGSATITESPSGSAVNGYVKTDGYDISWTGNIDMADGVFRNCADDNDKFFYAAASINPFTGQDYYYGPSWPAVVNVANLGEITSGAVLLHTVTGVGKPYNVNYSYHVNNVSSIPNYLACVYAPPEESWIRSTAYRGVLTEVHYYTPLNSSNILPLGNGDNSAPALSLTSTPKGLTFVDDSLKTWAKEATITATITDTKSKPSATSPIKWSSSSGLISDWGKTANTIFSSNDTVVTDSITSSNNITYTVEARDGLLNTTSASHTVNYIDLVNPVITNTLTTINDSNAFNGKDYTNTDVTLSFSASDSGCGFPASPYSWDGGTTWTNTTTHTVTTNCTINLVVRDGLNNTSSSSFVIDNIDKVSPSVNASVPSNWYAGEATVTVSANDNVALSSTPYSWDGGSTWTNSNSKKFSNSTDFNIKVRDIVGNITTKSVSLKKQNILTPPTPPTPPKEDTIIPKIDPIIPRVDPIIPKIDPIIPKVDPIIPKVDPIIPKVDPIKPITPPKDEPIIPKDDTKKEKTPITQKEKETVSTNSISKISPVNPTKTKTIAASAGIATGIVGFFFFLFMIFGMVKVYADTEENEEKYLGRARIKRKSGTYHIPLSHSLLNRANTSNYKLKFHKEFSKRKADCKLLIALPKSSIDSFVQDVVPFQYD